MTELASRKRPSIQEPNWNKCLCHVVEKAEGKLTAFSDKSWQTFQRCASRRKDAIWMKMTSFWNEGPRGSYHRQCYQAYTDKNKVTAAEQKTIKEDQREVLKMSDECMPSPPKRIRRSQLPDFDINKCAICQKEKIRNSKGARTRESLALNISELGSTSLLRAAQIRNDTRLLLHIEGQDMIAMEIKYHRTCYKDYVRQKELEKLEENNCQVEDNREEGYNKAFNKVKEIVEEEILTGAKAIPMSDLLDKYIGFLADEGISAATYRSSKLKNRLIRCFGRKLCFRRPANKNQADIVFSSLVDIGEVVETIFKNKALDEEYEDKETRDEDDDVEAPKAQKESYCVFHASKLIRRLLVDVKPIMPWPPSPDDLNCDDAMVPDLVYNMIAWIVCPQSEYSDERVSRLSRDAHRLVLSICQDLIHSVSRGRVKTPKHVALPMTVKSLTGNVELITILNKFGHGLSYTQIEELETALAEKQIAKQRDGILIPNVCSPEVPGIFCWDNNDLHEETLSGKGTTHCTNGIVIQRKQLTCALPPEMPDKQALPRNRSIAYVPSDVLPFSSRSRKGPSPVIIDVTTLVINTSQVSEHARIVDFGWMLCRQPVQDTLFTLAEDQPQVIPAWAGFNTILQEDCILRECSIGYCPVIEASPTELPTVYTVLQRSMQMADQLSQRDVIVVFDQPIYAKALEIMWQNEEQFQRLVVRMGTFHVICAYIAAIGKRFGDAGLSDVLMESEIVASGSVSGVLEGRHYNRAIRTHKIVYEALHRLQWMSFKAWLQKHGHPVNHAVVVSTVADIRKEFSKDKFNRLLSMEEFVALLKLYREYCTDDHGPMKEFWNSYLEMVQVLLNTVRATREGNWNMHLECVKEMLPWFFAYDHTNYARYLPVYLIDMLTLQDTHPEAHTMLENGDFGVQRTTHHGFSQVPVDQSIEQTLNRSTKTKGGIVGFSLRKAAVQRWMLTAHERAAFVDKCRNLTTFAKESNPLHKENVSARMKRDEADVKKVLEVIENWRNPFGPSEELVSLSSGRVASEDVKQDLLMAKEKGKTSLLSFVNNRLITNSTGFFEPLKKLKLGTFRDAQKTTSLKSGGKNIIIKADRNLFARLLVIGQSRKIDLRELLKHELGPLPWSLASFDGSLAKTNKAALSKLLEDGVECLQGLPDRTTVLIIDAMAMLQSTVKVPDRFGALAEMVMNKILSVAEGATRVDFVADQYHEISIKDAERDKRGSSGQLVIDITSPQQLCPRQWKKFMACGSNKTSLLKFFVHEWSTNQYAQRIKERTLYVTHGESCTKIFTTDGKVVSSEIVDELCSNQEEADTRMFLHANHASRNGHQKIAIKSSDTDVEVLACYYQAAIPSELILISGTQSTSRLVHIPMVCNSLGLDTCRALPGIHALTGCDTVSSFASKGKKKALAIVRQSQASRTVVETLGESVPADNLDQLEQFVCTLYNDPKCERVNELRYQMFCKSKNLQSHQLPPTKAALTNHLKRANFQAYLWKHALEATINQSPEGQGWDIKDGCLEIHWTDQPPAPEAVMALVCCGCKGKCQTRRCSCVNNGLPCTEACGCDKCENAIEEETIQDDDDICDIDESEDDNADELLEE